MIGDNLETDIEFAKNGNIDSILPLTGVTSEKDLQNIIEGKKQGILPTYYTEFLL